MDFRVTIMYSAALGCGFGAWQILEILSLVGWTQTQWFISNLHNYKYKMYLSIDIKYILQDLKKIVINAVSLLAEVYKVMLGAKINEH